LGSTVPREIEVVAILGCEIDAAVLTFRKFSVNFRLRPNPQELLAGEDVKVADIVNRVLLGIVIPNVATATVIGKSYINFAALPASSADQFPSILARPGKIL